MVKSFRFINTRHSNLRNILNAPIKTFEQSMSGYGMQVKYLMAGFLAIYALTMLITFTSFFMSNSSKLLKTNSN